MTDDVHALHLRICRLEAELTRTADQVETMRRRWRRAIRAAVAVGAATVASVTGVAVLASFTSLASLSPFTTLGAQAAPPDTSTTVTAPFRVVDKNGKIIMIVSESLRTLEMRDGQGLSSVSLTALKGGIVSLRSDNDIGVSLGATGILNGLRITRGLSKIPDDKHPPHVEAALEVNEIEGGNLWVANKAGKNILYAAETVKPEDGRVAIGTPAGSTFGIRVYSTGAKMLTSMGEMRGGPGAIAAYDATGVAKAAMFGNGEVDVMSAGVPVAGLSSKDNQGKVLVNNSSQTTVALLTTAHAGGGLLELADTAGNPQAKMGVTAAGEGNTCIRVEKRGDVCLGTQGLPSMMPGAH